MAPFIFHTKCAACSKRCHVHDGRRCGIDVDIQDMLRIFTGKNIGAWRVWCMDIYDNRLGSQIHMLCSKVQERQVERESVKEIYCGLRRYRI